MSKRGNLASFKAVKSHVPGASVPALDREQRRGQTLRLSLEAWRQLKLLAIEQNTPAHALLIEAVNDLFEKNGKSRIA